MPEGSCAVVNAIDVLARLPARRIDWARDDDRGIERSPWGGLRIAVYQTSIAAS